MRREATFIDRVATAFGAPNSASYFLSPAQMFQNTDRFPQYLTLPPISEMD